MATTLGEVLNGRDTISTKDATVYLTINGQNIPLIECNKLTVKLEKNKEDVQVLGNHWKKKKVTSVEGTGTLGGYLINSIWAKYGIPYTDGQADLYMDLVFNIEDKTSAAGKQTIHLGQVNLDDVPIVDFEADDDVMQWESDFTFEEIDLVQEFDGKFKV